MISQVFRVQKIKSNNRSNIDFDFPDDLPHVDIDALGLPPFIINAIEQEFPKGQRSEPHWGVICDLVREGIPPEVIPSIILDPANTVAAHCLDQKSPRAYGEKEIRKAMAEIAAEEEVEKNLRDMLLRGLEGTDPEELDPNSKPNSGHEHEAPGSDPGPETEPETETEPEPKPKPDPRDSLWPDPKPLPDGLPPVASFDPAFLPAAIAPWAMDIAEGLQCPLDYVGIPAMVMMGSLIGRKIGIRPQQRTSWYEVPNLWGMIIGPPGSLKSPAIDEVLKPLRRFDAESGKEHAAAMKEYEHRLEMY